MLKTKLKMFFLIARNLIEQDDQSSTSTSNSFTIKSTSIGDLYSVNSFRNSQSTNQIKNCQSSNDLKCRDLSADDLVNKNNCRNYQLNNQTFDEPIYSPINPYSPHRKLNQPNQPELSINTDPGYYSKCNSLPCEQCSISCSTVPNCSLANLSSRCPHNSINQQSDLEEDFDDEDDLFCCSSPDCKLTTHSNCQFKNRTSARLDRQNTNQTLLHLEENQKPFLQLKIFIPEFALEKSLIVSKSERIFKLKLYVLDLLETIKQNCDQQQRDLQLFFANTSWSKSTSTLNSLLNSSQSNADTFSKSKLGKFSKSQSLNKSESCLKNEHSILKLNYGLWCPLIGRFLEEERTVGDYSQLINNFIFYNYLKNNFAQQSDKTADGDFSPNAIQHCPNHSNKLLAEQQIDLPIYHFVDEHFKFDKSTFNLNLNQRKLYGLSKVNEDLNILNNLVRKVIKYNYIELEFRYKQRVELSFSMSTTLPTSTQTKKRRKRTRLLETIAAGNIEKVAKLVQNCDPNFVDELSGETPLTLACSLHTTQTVATNALSQNLANGQSNSSQDTKHNLTNGNLSGNEKERKKEKESKFFTLKSKSDKPDVNNEDAHPYINPKNVFNPTVIQRLIVTLVNGGALLDFRAKESGRTPLHVAVLKSNLIAIKTLLDLGCSPNHVDANGLTTLFYSIIYRCSAKITQQLLQHHACLNTRDTNGWMEIHHICKFGSVDQLELLLYYGCSIDAQISGSGNTALHVCAINDKQDCCRVLLQRGASTEIVNGSHQTAYQTSVIAGNQQLADLIANHKPENVQRYPEKPKYNSTQTKRVQLSTADSFDYPSVHGGKIRDDFGVKYCNSPCLSQRSNATTTATNTTNTSGVCCDTEETTSNHSGQVNEKNLYSTMRVQGRLKSCLTQTQPTNYATLPTNRARSDERKLTASNSIDSQTKFSIQQQQQPQIISYDEKTVMLKRTNKGFGFVLRGAKAPSPTQDQPASKENNSTTNVANKPASSNNTNKENIRNQTNSPPQCLRPVSLQYFEDIETGGVADQAGLRPGDYLINVNGTDVRSSIHEFVVNLIRQSGDQVTVTVATPIYQYEDSTCPKQLEAQQSAIYNGNYKPPTTNQVSDSRKSSIITEEVYDLTNKKAVTLSPSMVSRNSSTRCSAETLVCGMLPNSNSDQLNQRGKTLPPAPPKRDPNTTLSISRGRAKSLCINELIDDSLPPPDDLSPVLPDPPKSLINSTSLEPANLTTNIHSTVSSTKQQAPQPVNNNNVTNGISNYDSEGRSTGPSSPSVQSIIHNVKATKTTTNADVDQDKGAKVASIRSRSSRRISALELEEYFARQTDGNKNDKQVNGQLIQSSNNDKCGTLQTPKRKEKNGLEKKTFHSTSDLQAELAQEEANGQQQTNAEQKSHFETLTLKNGKFYSNRQPQSTLTKQTSLTKRDQNEMNKKLESKESNKQSVDEQATARPCKTSSSFSSALTTSSSFKPTNSLDESQMDPNLHIPEPDYSDDDKQAGKNLSTFKTPVDNDRLTQSVYESRSNEQQQHQMMSKSMISNEHKLKSIGGKSMSSAASNKVKESIKQFERRNVSLDGGKRKLESLENMINSTTNGIYNNMSSSVVQQQQQIMHNKIPTSKSCFEVDVCDLDKQQQQENDESKEKVRSNQQYYTLVKQSSINQESKLAPTTMAKTWSEISSAIRATKGNPSISTMAGSGQLTKTLPSSASSTKSALKQGAIRVQVDSLGLAAVNEIDVSTDVLLPPPEFCDPSKRKSMTSNLISGTQLLQQQVHQAKQQQLLQAQQHKLHQQQQQGKSTKSDVKIIAQQSKPQVINDPSTTIRKNLASINSSNLDAATKARLIQQVQQQNALALQQQPIAVSQAGQLSSSQFATLTRYVKQQQLQANQNNQQYVTISRLTNLDPNQTAQLANSCQLHSTSANIQTQQPTQAAVQEQQQQQQQQQQLNLYGTTIAQPPTSTNQTNYYQFATLSRAQQQQQLNSRVQQQQNAANLYSDYNKLAVQNSLIKPQQPQQTGNQSIVVSQANQQLPTSSALTQAQLLQIAQQQPQLLNDPNGLLRKNINTATLNAANLDPATRARLLQQQQQVQLLLQQQHLQQRQAQLKHQYQIQQQQKAVKLSKTPIVDWTANDVSEWLKAVGMYEHLDKFSDFNGTKLLQLDILELQKMNIRVPHCKFIMEKLKQHLVYQQAHQAV